MDRGGFFFFLYKQKRERPGAPTYVELTHAIARGFFLAQNVAYRSPPSLRDVSHDNMSHDSDQGLRAEERAERKTNISGYKLWLIPASAIIYNPPYRITFPSIIYGDPNLYEVFRALLLFDSVHRTRDG